MEKARQAQRSVTKVMAYVQSRRRVEQNMFVPLPVEYGAEACAEAGILSVFQ